MEIKFVSICADFDGEQMENSETGLLNNGLALKDISNHDKYWIGDTETTTNATSTLQEYIFVLILLNQPK